jgi:hypothetical protein
MHYDVFKNAGSSIDQMLETAFGRSWIAFDPVETYGHVMPAEPLERFIAEQPDIVAISSHIARPPVAQVAGVEVYPVAFVRHPTLRAASVFKDARKRLLTGPDTFSDFVRWHARSQSDSLVANYQTLLLSGAQPDEDGVMPRVDETSLEDALAFLGNLPAFGVVERFDESLDALRAWLAPVFPQIDWAPPPTRSEGAELATIDQIRENLGDEDYARLLAANAFDMRLYESAVRLFEQRRAR